MSTPTDTVGVITSGTADLLPTLLSVGGIAVGVSAGVLGLKKGWGFFSKMIKA